MQLRCRTAFAAVVPLLAILEGCGGQLPAPPTGPHRSDATKPAAIVGYPPPPVRAECIPQQPREECVWVDGSWDWTGRNWDWRPGAWLVAPADCYHAKAYSRWLRVGSTPGGASSDRLYYFEAGWYSNQPGGKCARPKVCAEALSIEEC